MRAVFGRDIAFTRNVINFLLAVLHARHIIGERNILRIVGIVRGGKAAQLGNSILVGKVFTDPFFKHAAKCPPESRIFVFLVFGQIIEQAQHFFHATIFNGIDIFGLLQNFARNIQRQIVRVHHAFYKAQIARQQLLRIIHDENAAHIQLDTVLAFTIPHIEGRFGGNIKQLRVFLLAFHTGMCPTKRLLPIMRDMLVKLLVLLLSDIVFRTGPQRAGAINSFIFVG